MPPSSPATVDAPGAEAATRATEKPCIACYEPIHSEAKVCPHCGSSQASARWTMIGASLKWVGGVTAVVSLVLATWQLRDLVQATREKAETVAELVRAADLQREASDYGNALALIDEALKLNPASREARALQVTIAMAKVRGIHALESDKLQALEPGTAILYRGAAQADRQGAADALAHLGWVYHLRRTAGENGAPIENFFRRALKLDPDNVFAHTLWADWCLNYKYDTGCENFETAATHYAAALTGSREQKFVYESILGYFCGTDLEIRFKQCAIFFANMKKNGYALTGGQREALKEAVDDIFLSESKFTALLKEGDRVHITSGIEWIAEDEQAQKQPIDEQHVYRQRLWSPRLKELAGKTADALAEYKQLRLDAHKWEGQHTSYRTGIFPAVDQAVARLIDRRPGRLGLDLQELDEHIATRIGLPQGQGMQVQRTSPASLAHAAGIVVGDVILAVNGRDINSVEGMFIHRTTPAGETVELTIWRRRQPQKLNAVLVEVPAEEIEEEIEHTGQWEEWFLWFLAVMVDKVLYGPGPRPLPGYGLTLAGLTEELRRGYGIAPDVRGALILNNKRYAQHENLVAGDVIVEIDQQPISGPDDLVRAIEAAHSAHEGNLLLTRFRDGEYTALTWDLSPS